MEAEFKLFMERYNKNKSYQEKIDFLVSHLNILDRTKYYSRLKDLLIFETPKHGPDVILRQELVLDRIAMERLIEDETIHKINGVASFYCANGFYRLIRHAIETDESFNEKPGKDTRIHRVTGQDFILLGICEN